MAQFRFRGDPRDGFRGPDPQTFYGLSFSRDEWTEVPEHLVERLSRHSHLERDEDEASADPAKPDKAFAGGVKAHAAGKDRSVPPAYRGKPEEGRWLAGYDGEDA
jgi:hypothetical protein